MPRRTLLKTSIEAALALFPARKAGAQEMDETSQASPDVVVGLMGAMGSGDMDTVTDPDGR